ncbi:hypothetical protein [Mesorhizobium sp. CAU 1741]|uniref:hypothetical protein n=1 Tax=Mesorhizobium sp. CAU 1741 TaxID=3140366 RepID=UPI00325B7BCD
MNAALTASSTRIAKNQPNETIFEFARYYSTKENRMMIYLLATTMTLAMLIATAFGIHNEAQNAKLERQRQRVRRYPIG